MTQWIKIGLEGWSIDWCDWQCVGPLGNIWMLSALILWRRTDWCSVRGLTKIGNGSYLLRIVGETLN